MSQDATTLDFAPRSASAYGWSDSNVLDSSQGFRATKQNARFTISEPTSRADLDRLLALNHQRYAEEIKAGLHYKKGGKTRANTVTATAPPQGQMIHPPQRDLCESKSEAIK
jgi:hypothetical protein